MEKLITLANIIELTKEKFPEYKVEESDSVEPYYFYGGFMKFIIYKVTAEGDSLLLDRLIDFSNELFASKNVDNDVRNLIGVEVFENIVNEKKTAEYTRPKLNSGALDAFALAVKYSGHN